MNAELFKEELKQIGHASLRALVEAFIEQVPEYIEHVPASSTGKYHPSFDSGDGGLVRHLKMCAAVATELYRLNQYKDCNMDCVIAACILHDCYKNGYTDSGHTITTHDYICAKEFEVFAGKWIDEYYKNKGHKYNTERECMEQHVHVITNCIHAHMGQWSTNVVHANYNAAYLVAMADYVSSRKFFDKYNEYKI